MNTELTIVYHLGAPHTDNDQITWSLRKESDVLTERGTMIRRPKTYRKQISDMIVELDGDDPSVVDQESLLPSPALKGEVDRILMSNSSFLGVPVWMMYGGKLYQNAGKNTKLIRNLFPDNPCEFFLGISNPASFITSVYKAQNTKNYQQFMDNTDLSQIRWSDVISRIKLANPDCPITVWCNEDTPVIWPTILREVAGLDEQTRLKGEFDVINQIMSEEGTNLMAKFLDERPNMTEIQRRRVRAAFLEKFFLDDAVEEVADLPGWTEGTVNMLTDLYEEDIAQIAQMPGVNFLSV